MDKIENQNNILEGIVESPQQKQRLFKSLNDLVEYVSVFKIENFRCDSGVLQGTNEKVLQLSYLDYQGD